MYRERCSLVPRSGVCGRVAEGWRNLGADGLAESPGVHYNYHSSPTTVTLQTLRCLWSRVSYRACIGFRRQLPRSSVRVSLDFRPLILATFRYRDRANFHDTSLRSVVTTEGNILGERRSKRKIQGAGARFEFPLRDEARADSD